MRLRRFILHEIVLDIQVDEHQFYQHLDTINECALFSSHNHTVSGSKIRKENPSPDGKPSRTRDKATTGSLRTTLLPKPETTIPTPHMTRFEIPPILQEDAPVATPHDDLSSPKYDSPKLECEKHPVSHKPVNVPPQPASTPLHDKGDHESQEQGHALTHSTRYKLRENPKARICQDKLMLELSNQPTIAKFLLSLNH